MRLRSVLLMGVAAIALGACSKVPAGNVGIMVDLYGGSQGVDLHELTPGRYWVGWNQELYLFPTFTQNYVYSASSHEGKPLDESIVFQTAQGTTVKANVGISYHIAPECAAKVFQKYRRGVDEITDIYLHNMVRDAFVISASTRDIEAIYGTGKGPMMKEINDKVKTQADAVCIGVETIYLVGDMDLPDQVKTAINAKINATQQAEQAQNEVARSTAEAQKTVAIANGEAQSILLKATAEAQANDLVSKSITSQLVQYEQIKKWNGVMPMVSGGGALPLINITPKQ